MMHLTYQIHQHIKHIEMNHYQLHVFSYSQVDRLVYLTSKYLCKEEYSIFIYPTRSCSKRSIRWARSRTFLIRSISSSRNDWLLFGVKELLTRFVAGRFEWNDQPEWSLWNIYMDKIIKENCYFARSCNWRSFGHTNGLFPASFIYKIYWFHFTMVLIFETKRK
jgi:hypothetical protein